ncbi:hypothetical protein FALBO_1683 [Fusarium albosuccineum]|uniref:Uncharacterized protein n=1 Tax=Fusarium albosuccineum TaxID=1237068 RepID=A0A8H4LPS6_9HYPO|nr:hypothetical protein FALBO_1683 [Fusarium albosuccineum]KAF4990440.1 hypothetical protein FDECE_14381 [Fusarium decemcellulare]
MRGPFHVRSQSPHSPPKLDSCICKAWRRRWESEQQYEDAKYLRGVGQSGARTRAGKGRRDQVEALTCPTGPGAEPPKPLAVR